MRSNSFIRLPGDHKKWNVYRKSVIVCDVTEMFVRRSMTYSARTAEQMRQAARSCKQNLVEGVSDKTVSIEMCIKLLGVALGPCGNLPRTTVIFCARTSFPRGLSRTRGPHASETIAATTMIRKIS